MVSALEDLFPGLRGSNYRTTSPPSKNYNCIAWAAGEVQTCWWPSDDDRDTWPANIARQETLSAFQQAFASLGYMVCEDSKVEPGFEKIALFADANGTPLHAARQVPSGRWSSKLGELEDIEQELRDLEGKEYGSVVLLMKRASSTVAEAAGS
jgi:hypothetical protein